MKQHIKYLQQAMELAYQGYGKTWPNPMVGAVVVKAGRVMARGWHKQCGADHAEIDALKKIGHKAKGMTLYVTLEPCSHWGRTPPCTMAIIQAGIKKVVIGTLDPNPINHGQSLKILRQAGIEVEFGFLQKELIQMNEVFNKYMTKHMPFVVAKCAQSLDGKIATALGDSKWITSKRSRAHAHNYRNNFDAIMVGINTVLKDNPRLDPVPLSKKLKKIIIDSRLRTPMDARLIKDSEVIIATTKQAPQSRINQFVRRGISVLVCPGHSKRVDLTWLFRQLAVQEIAHVLIEGGGQLVGNALDKGLVDKMMIYVAPKIIGDSSAIGSISGLNRKKMDQALILKDMHISLLGEDLLIEGSL